MTNQEEHMDFEEMCKQSEKSHRRGKITLGYDDNRPRNNEGR